MSKQKSAVNVQEFCKDRIDEILMLTEAMNESPFRGQAFQRLPKHMRRRQMSHYIKRLPRRLRNSSLLSIHDGGGEVPKRPSRKFRRRPGNLLLEYNRRQKKNIWLETHIWHARRFHMTSKWNYFLPERPTNKSFRACYKATSNHCFINDMSYYGVIELNGEEDILLKGLQQCVSINCGLTFVSRMFKSGMREGFVTMYHPNSFPYSVIGEVSFLWKPIEPEDKGRTIWITAHPTIYNEIADVFQTLFQLKVVECTPEITNKIEDVCDEEKREGIENSKHFLHKIPEFRDDEKNVTMKLLKNKLNRIRLRGPLSLAVISNAFDVISHSSENVTYLEMESGKLKKANSVTNELKRSNSHLSDDKDTDVKRVKLETGETSITNVYENNSSNVTWWNTFYKSIFRKKCLENQANFYKDLTSFHSPSNLPPGMVLSLVVRDPRLNMPPKRIKCTPTNKGSTYLTDLDPTLSSSSCFWEANVRDEIYEKIPSKEINKARNKLIVPGTDISKVLDVTKQAKVPIIIIQRTSPLAVNSSSSLDFGSGFDILVPLGWAMPVWLSLIYRGARPGGLRETQSLILESKNISEHIQPDSNAGKAENVERFTKLKEIYFKRPPNKRPNFSKIGVDCPFYFPWQTLINDWVNMSHPLRSKSEFFVLRDLKKLSELSTLLSNAGKKSKNSLQCIEAFALDDKNCLVPVCVESCGKGAPKENAMLCLPTPEDVQEFKTGKKYPVEAQHSDPHLKKRKCLKVELEKILKSLKRKRRNRKVKLIKSEEQNNTLPISSKNKMEVKSEEEKKFSSNDIVNKYNEKLESLWLKHPENIETLINSCSRKVFGYIVLGGYSFSQGKGVGLGYVTLNGLLSLLERIYKDGLHPLVLFRNNNMVTYRFARISVCINKNY